MNIHIVHLPHTFPFLLDLSLAFQRFGFQTITLVANGFNLDQIKALDDFANKNPCIRILDLPTKRILSHGEALNYAFRLGSEEIFCFADHDIFPIAPVIEDIASGLKNNAAVCLGNRPENMVNYKGFAASATQTASGIPLITSFFSAFRRDAVAAVSHKYKVGFEQYFRKSQLPLEFRQFPDIKALKEPFLIDTCKALSLAFYLSHKSIVHVEAEKVCHLGGLSGAISKRLAGKTAAPETAFIFEQGPGKEALLHYYQKHQKRHPHVLRTKQLIADYALQTIINLKSSRPPPAYESEDAELEKRLTHIKVNLEKVIRPSIND